MSPAKALHRVTALESQPTFADMAEQHIWLESRLTTPPPNCSHLQG